MNDSTQDKPNARAMWSDARELSPEQPEWRWLLERGLDPAQLRGQCKVLSTPYLARYTLAFPLWTPDGELQTLNVRTVEPGAQLKSMTLTGTPRRGAVMANGAALDWLRGGSTPELLVIVEGEMDFAAAVCATPETAIVGIDSGSWTPGHSARVPGGCTVAVWTDNDSAGARYASKIAESFARREDVTLLRGKLASGDVNDAWKAGTLPSWTDAALLPIPAPLPTPRPTPVPVAREQWAGSEDEGSTRARVERILASAPPKGRRAWLLPWAKTFGGWVTGSQWVSESVCRAELLAKVDEFWAGTPKHSGRRKDVLEAFEVGKAQPLRPHDRPTRAAPRPTRAAPLPNPVPVREGTTLEGARAKVRGAVSIALRNGGAHWVGAGCGVGKTHAVLDALANHADWQEKTADWQEKTKRVLVVVPNHRMQRQWAVGLSSRGLHSWALSPWRRGGSEARELQALRDEATAQPDKLSQYDALQRIEHTFEANCARWDAYSAALESSTAAAHALCKACPGRVSCVYQREAKRFRLALSGWTPDDMTDFEPVAVCIVTVAWYLLSEQEAFDAETVVIFDEDPLQLTYAHAPGPQLAKVLESGAADLLEALDNSARSMNEPGKSRSSVGPEGVRELCANLVIKPLPDKADVETFDMWANLPAAKASNWHACFIYRGELWVPVRGKRQELWRSPVGARGSILLDATATLETARAVLGTEDVTECAPWVPYPRGTELLQLAIPTHAQDFERAHVASKLEAVKRMLSPGPWLIVGHKSLGRTDLDAEPEGEAASTYAELAKGLETGLPDADVIYHGGTESRASNRFEGHQSAVILSRSVPKGALEARAELLKGLYPDAEGAAQELLDAHASFNLEDAWTIQALGRIRPLCSPKSIIVLQERKVQGLDARYLGTEETARELYSRTGWLPDTTPRPGLREDVTPIVCAMVDRALGELFAYLERDEGIEELFSHWHEQPAPPNEAAFIAAPVWVFTHPEHYGLPIAYRGRCLEPTTDRRAQAWLDKATSKWGAEDWARALAPLARDRGWKAWTSTEPRARQPRKVACIGPTELDPLPMSQDLAQTEASRRYAQRYPREGTQTERRARLQALGLPRALGADEDFMHEVDIWRQEIRSGLVDDWLVRKPGLESNCSFRVAPGRHPLGYLCRAWRWWPTGFEGAALAARLRARARGALVRAVFLMREESRKPRKDRGNG